MKRIHILFIGVLFLTVLTSCKQSISDEYEYLAIVPELSVTTTSLSIQGTGGSQSVSVQSNACWKASTHDSWLHVDNTSHKGSASVQVSADANEKLTERTGSVTISDGINSATISVTQAAGQAKNFTVGTLSVSSITNSSAVCSFTYSSENATISEYGVCYSTTANVPTIDGSDCSSVSQSSTSDSGTATLSLTDLNEKTTYYVRPYVRHSEGVVYGDPVRFNTAGAHMPGEDDNPTPTYSPKKY